MYNIADHVNWQQKEDVKEYIEKNNFTLFTAITSQPLVGEKIKIVFTDMDCYACECTAYVQKAGTQERIIGLDGGFKGNIMCNLIAWKHISYDYKEEKLKSE